MSQTEPVQRLLARNLRESVLPFWTRHTWDEVYGGFLGHIDDRGRPTAVTDKYLLIQARMIWTLSAAHRHGLRDRGYLELAARGIRFLTTHLWDGEHEGFFHAVRREGTPLDTRKWVYTQSFVIFALSEYFLASGDAEALAWAVRLFEVVQRRAGEGEAGWREYLRRDWSPEWRPRRYRTSNLHMHLLEAVTVLYQATRREEHRRALALLMEIMLRRTLHPSGCVLERFSLDWRRPRFSVDFQVTTSYGHGAELAHLLDAAGRTLGWAEADYVPAAVRLVNHALVFGFDAARGGIARYGRPDRHVLHARTLRARRLLRGSWEQAEMLLGLLTMYARTRRADLKLAVGRQVGWIWRHQLDHERGDWHPWVSWPEGRPLGSPKGNDHLCCYHQARALMGGERLLEELGLPDWVVDVA